MAPGQTAELWGRDNPRGDEFQESLQALLRPGTALSPIHNQPPTHLHTCHPLGLWVTQEVIINPLRGTGPLRLPWEEMTKSPHWTLCLWLVGQQVLGSLLGRLEARSKGHCTALHPTASTLWPWEGGWPQPSRPEFQSHALSRHTLSAH